MLFRSRVREDVIGGSSWKERGQHSAGGAYRTGKNEASPDRRRSGFNERWDVAEYNGAAPSTRNKRSVWAIATAPFNGSALLADYVGADGRAYRRSEDCPAHGLNDRRQTPQMGGCGEQQDRPENDSGGTDGCLGAEHGGAHAATLSMTTDKNRLESAPAHEPQSTGGHKKRGRSLRHHADASGAAAELPLRSDGTQECTTLPPDRTGSLPLACSETAKPHSNGSHRTDLAPATSLACSASAQTVHHTGDISEIREPSDLAERSHASNSAPDGPVDHPSGRKVIGSGRKSSSGQDSRKCTCLPVSTDHFATFPPELPEICIKAGCPVGGMVLDPFAGAGTTLMVADRLQRNAIGIELNPEYAAMAERRISGDRGALLDIMEAAQ